MNVITNHLADHDVEDFEPLKFDFSNKNVLSIEEGKSDWWIMYFDGAVVTEWGQC